MSLSGQEIEEICCIGAGFVGGSTGAVLASQLENINVTVVDINQARIDAWNSSALPISEPGLEELVELGRGLKNFTYIPEYCERTTATTLSPSCGSNVGQRTGRSSNLHFTTDVDNAIRKADLIFACVDTPSMTEDGLLGRPLDTRALLKAVKRVGEVAVKDFILVEKCTVPCGTAQQIENTLRETVRPGVHFEILSNPEFLAEGSAIQDLLHPSRVLIGSFPTKTAMNAALTLAAIYEKWVPRERILTTDTWSSELSKLAANALLAQRISSINSLSMICESLNADIRTVSTACALDERIGPHMLNASVGFGGSCFHKDISYLVYLAASLGLEDVARYWQAVLDINEEQQTRFSGRVARKLSNLGPADSKIAVLGFAFKAKTNDTRNSAAIRVVKELIRKGFEIAIYDPCIEETDILSAISDGRQHPPPPRVSVCSSALKACMEARAVVVLTDWDGFRYPLVTPKINIATRYDAGPPTPDSLDHGELLSCYVTGRIDPCDIGHVAEADNLEKTRVPLTEERPDQRLNSSDGRGVFHGSKRESISRNHAQVQEYTRWEEVAEVMLEPKQIFDGRNIIADGIIDLGFKIERIGKTSKIE